MKIAISRKHKAITPPSPNPERDSTEAGGTWFAKLELVGVAVRDVCCAGVVVGVGWDGVGVPVADDVFSISGLGKSM